MKTSCKLLIAVLLCAAAAWPQCGKLVLNPRTHQWDCIGAGSGAGGQYSAPSATYTIGTWYIPPGGGAAPTATEADGQGRVNATAAFSNFSASLSTAPGSGHSVAFTWRKGGVDQALTCTISNAATNCADVTHSFTASPGDLVDIKMIIAGADYTGRIVALWGLPGLAGSAGASGTNGTAASTSSVFASPPTASTGAFWYTTDCIDLSCSAGGGSLKVLQVYNGAAWVPFISANSCAGCAGYIASQPGTGDGGFGQAAVANCGSTGTTVNKLAKIVGGCAVIATTGDTAIPLYCVEDNAGTTGHPTLALIGQGTCKVEAAGGVTADHFLVASATTAATLHDAGATAPTSGWVLGQAQASASANANVQYAVSPPGYNSASGGGGGSTTQTRGLPFGSCGASIQAYSPFWSVPGSGGYTGYIGSVDCGTVATNPAHITWAVADEAKLIYYAFAVPSNIDLSTAASFRVKVTGIASITGNAKFTAGLACTADGALGNAALSFTTGAATVSVSATDLTIVDVNVTGLTWPGGCAAGSTAALSLTRTTVASDYASYLLMWNPEFTYAVH